MASDLLDLLDDHEKRITELEAIRCTCKVCHRSREISRICKQYQLSSTDAHLILSMNRELEYVETDAVYWEAKFRGTWSNSNSPKENINVPAH